MQETKYIKNISTVTLFCIGLLMTFASSSYAFSINVNGNLGEWGVTPDVYGSALWNPNPGIYNAIDDDSPDPDLNSNWPIGTWGDPYDVEALYLTTDTNNLYYAVVTTFPAGGYEDIVPGDLAFDFGIDGTYEYGISSINRNGFFNGNLYSVTSWNNGFWGFLDPLADPTYISTGNERFSSLNDILAYNNDFYYTDKGEHYVIEGYLPHSAFGSNWGKSFRMHWAMSCGNDYLNLDYNPAVPEPATLSLLGLGLLGLIGFRRKGGR